MGTAEAELHHFLSPVLPIAREEFVQLPLAEWLRVRGLPHEALVFSEDVTEVNHHAALSRNDPTFHARIEVVEVALPHFASRSSKATLHDITPMPGSHGLHVADGAFKVLQHASSLV